MRGFIYFGRAKLPLRLITDELASSDKSSLILSFSSSLLLEVMDMCLMYFLSSPTSRFLRVLAVVDLFGEYWVFILLGEFCCELDEELLSVIMDNV